MDCCHAGAAIDSRTSFDIKNSLALTATDVGPVVEILGACHPDQTTASHGRGTFICRLARVRFELRQKGARLHTMAINTELFKSYYVQQDSQSAYPFYFSMSGNRPIDLGPLYYTEFK